MGVFGLERASAGNGPTIKRFNIAAEADHIYTHGFVIEAAGKVPNAAASDHLPVWVWLKPNEGLLSSQES